MLYSPFVSEKHWHGLRSRGTLLQYFLRTKYYSRDRSLVNLGERGTLLNALNSNEVFLEFWNIIQDQHPTKKNYFSALTNEDEPYDSSWIRSEYCVYMVRKAFEALSEEERRELQEGFDESMASVYQAAVEGESIRLNCNIAEVMPISPVLPWKPDHDKESMLAMLPDQLFGRVIPFLENLDIFNMTLVCKRWKRLIVDNAKELKRAEHSLTTHLIRFTNWMHPAKTLNDHTLSYRHQMFSWCLTRWYCGVTQNLETLIVDHEVSYTKLADLLQSCPNLKHLRVGYDLDLKVCALDIIRPAVELGRLETFMSSSDYFVHCFRRSSRKLKWDILVSSPSLRVLKHALDKDDLIAINDQIPLSNVFGKLIALDLHYYTVSTLEILAQIDTLELRYLRLNTPTCSSHVAEISAEEQLTNALDLLLPKLKKLEMLRTSAYIGVTNKTIQLMTDLKLNISWAVLHDACYPTKCDEEGVNLLPAKGIDPLQPEVFDGFCTMLLRKNPNVNLSNIRFLLRDEKTAEILEAMNSGFTILKTDKSFLSTFLVDELCNPKFKQRLGIDY